MGSHSRARRSFASDAVTDFLAIRVRNSFMALLKTERDNMPALAARKLAAVSRSSGTVTSGSLMLRIGMARRPVIERSLSPSLSFEDSSESSDDPSEESDESSVSVSSPPVPFSPLLLLSVLSVSSPLLVPLNGARTSAQIAKLGCRGANVSTHTPGGQ